MPPRALIEPAEMPPRELAGYGVVAFTTRALPHDIERYKSVCEAYKATLMAQAELPPDTPLSQQMITYWPIAKKTTPEAQRAPSQTRVDSRDASPTSPRGSRRGRRRGTPRARPRSRAR